MGLREILTSPMGVLMAALLAAGCSTGLTPSGGIQDTFVSDGDDDDDLPGDSGGGPIGDDDDDDDAQNQPPTADAGDDLLDAEVTDVVQLDGSGSYDPDGDPLSYAWSFTSQPAGSTASLINATRVNPSFFVDRAGDYVIQLTVSDGIASDTDEVVVSAVAPNEGPVANAGPDQVVDVGDRVQLNGSASYDPDGDPITFAWTLSSRPAGSIAALDNPSSVLPRFTADVAGVYTVSLAVTDDGANWSPPDVVLITAQEPNDSDCISCAQVQMEAQRRIRAGDVASGAGLVFLPLVALFYQRRRHRGEDR